MKVYTEEVTCTVCGGTGMARPRDAVAEWFGGEIVHNDPRVCADNLRYQRRKLEAERRKFEEERDQGRVGTTQQAEVAV